MDSRIREKNGLKALSVVIHANAGIQEAEVICRTRINKADKIASKTTYALRFLTPLFHPLVFVSTTLPV